MKKKIALFLVASAVALSFSACGKNASDIDSVSEEQVAVVEETTEEIAKTEVTEPEATEVEVEATVEEIEVEITEETAAEETTAEEKVEETPVEEAKEEAKEETPKVTIPDWFDAAYYAANNADVVAALGSSPEALYNHYTQFGKAEGRAAYEGDPNAVAKAESPAPAGEPAQNEGGATTQTPWGDLYVIYGEGWDSYFYSPFYQENHWAGDAINAAQTELMSRVSSSHYGTDWTVVGTYNGMKIEKWFLENRE